MIEIDFDNTYFVAIADALTKNEWSRFLTFLREEENEGPFIQDPKTALAGGIVTAIILEAVESSLGEFAHQANIKANIRSFIQNLLEQTNPADILDDLETLGDGAAEAREFLTQEVKPIIQGIRQVRENMKEYGMVYAS